MKAKHSHKEICICGHNQNRHTKTWPGTGQCWECECKGYVHDRHGRVAAHQRKAKKRSRYKRCSNCKKLRMYRLPGNWWEDPSVGGESPAKAMMGRRKWAKLIPDGPKVCYICVQRAQEQQSSSTSDSSQSTKSSSILASSDALSAGKPNP